MHTPEERAALVQQARALLGQGMTQNKAAERLNLPPGTLRRWLSEEAEPPTVEVPDNVEALERRVLQTQAAVLGRLEVALAAKRLDAGQLRALAQAATAIGSLGASMRETLISLQGNRPLDDPKRLEELEKKRQAAIAAWQIKSAN